MLTYSFTARDPKSGNKINSTVQASDEHHAVKHIKEQGYLPLEITLTKDEGAKNGLTNLANRISTKDKVIFSRQLSTLINAGLPLVQSLRAVQEQTSKKSFKQILANTISDVEGGSSFSDALAKHPKEFNAVYVNLVAAGETSGTLDGALERLANQQEKDAEIVSKVRGALIYPLIVVLVMIAVVIFMLTAVLPRVQELYKGLPGAHLPFITVILLDLSNFITHFWWVCLLILAGGGYYFSRWSKTGPGRETMDRLKIRAWPFNNLFMKMYMARFTRTSQTLVASGVPLLQIMDIVGKAVDNTQIAHSLNTAADKVKGGKALSESLTGDTNFLSLVPQMIKIGEQSGSMEAMLGRTADYYEKELDNEIKTISSLIEPLLMVVMGIAALVIVAAVLLPIYGLVGKFQV